MSKTSPSDGRIEERTKSGEANYQVRIKTVLDEAINYQINGDVVKFCRATWSAIRLLANKMDIKELMGFVEKRVDDKNKIISNDLQSKQEFIDFIQADPNGFEKFLFENEIYYPVWYDIYNIAREAFDYRYSGVHSKKFDDLEKAKPDKKREKNEEKQDVPY